MATIIPFVTQLTEAEEQAELSVLRPLLPDYDLFPLSAIAQDQRKEIEGPKYPPLLSTRRDSPCGR